MKIKLIFGTDTGNTDYVIETYLLDLLDSFEVEVTEVPDLSPEDWQSNEFFIL